MNKVNVKHGRWRPKKTWREIIRKDMSYMTIGERMISIYVCITVEKVDSRSWMSFRSIRFK